MGRGGSWRSRCLLPGLLRPSKRTSSNPTTASFHLHSFFLFLLPSACISTCSFFCWSFVRRPLLYCVCCMQSTGSAGPFATQPCVQLRCYARCRPRKRQRAYDKKRTVSDPSISSGLSSTAHCLPLPRQKTTAHIVSDGEYWTGLVPMG